MCDSTESAMSQIWLFVDVCLSTVSRPCKELFCVSCTSFLFVFSPFPAWATAVFENNHTWQIHVTIIHFNSLLSFNLWAILRHFDTQISVCVCERAHILYCVCQSVLIMNISLKQKTRQDWSLPSHVLLLPHFGNLLISVASFYSPCGYPKHRSHPF